MTSEIRAGKYEIGHNHPPFIVAEMSGNHGGSLDRALDLVKAAAAAGAHALKLQTYTADTMTLDVSENEFVVANELALWKGRSLYDLYEEAHTPWEWHRPIKTLCDELGLVFFSTPFDDSAVEFLEELQVPLYKIASFENNHIPLIKKVAKTGKPVIISTGMASIDQVQEAVDAAKSVGNEKIILLKCTSNYPASPASSNLRAIPLLSKAFGVEVGLSDHTLGIGVAVASVAFGSCLIEKHVTLDRNDGGVDSAFSLEPHELKLLVEETHRAWLALGEEKIAAAQEEKSSKTYRRSIYIAKDMELGEVFTEANLRCIRPGLGLAPKYFEMVLGKTVKVNARKGTPLSWDMVLD